MASMSSWAFCSAQPQSHAWHTPVFNMTFSVVSHVRKGSPGRNIFFQKMRSGECSSWAPGRQHFVFTVLDPWGPAQCPRLGVHVLNWTRTRLRPWVTRLCPSAAFSSWMQIILNSAWNGLTPGWKKRKIPPHGPKSSCFSFLKKKKKKITVFFKHH